jgi:chromosome segregation ATPase
MNQPAQPGTMIIGVDQMLTEIGKLHMQVQQANGRVGEAHQQINTLSNRVKELQKQLDSAVQNAADANTFITSHDLADESKETRDDVAAARKHNPEAMAAQPQLVVVKPEDIERAADELANNPELNADERARLKALIDKHTVQNQRPS